MICNAPIIPVRLRRRSPRVMRRKPCVDRRRCVGRTTCILWVHDPW